MTSPWISADLYYSGTLPDYGSHVLCVGTVPGIHDTPCIFIGCRFNSGFYTNLGEGNNWKVAIVTHWMPLPPQPDDPPVTVFKKTYDGESLYDVQRDIIEAFDPRFNPGVSQIPQDEYGFQTGEFVVTVQWKKD